MPLDALALRPRVHLAAAVGECLFQSVVGTEAVSCPFRYELEMVAEDVDLDAARGSEALLELTDTDGRERFVHGVVEEISVSPTAWEDRYVYRLTIVPEPYLLRHRHGFRVFQALSVPDICRRVFERAGLSGERFEWRLSASYAPRELCVQYDESEWDFVSRLCEAEGIWYRFEHRADGHVMVFGDDSARTPRIESSPLPFAFGHDDALGARAYAVRDGLISVEDRVSLDDYDRLRPSQDLAAPASSDPDSAREWYEYPGEYADVATGRRLARSRLEEIRSRHHTLEIETTAFDAVAGKRLVVAGAPIDVPDAFIVESRLAISHDESDAERSRAESTLTVIPETQAFRPPRSTPQPRIVGVQTARVTGPAGEEIHVDEHGRVKVQFHWDRDAQLDEHASCWVPVAQGQTTGAIMHPRIGWEVVVEFREGNPDRPLVTGRVYNPFFPPPHALPERKTVTAHRSDSLPGRERIHEIRFEDLAGDEHIAITAGHDLREVTVVNRRVAVHHDENREVGANRAEIVGVLQRVRAERNHSDSVGLTQTIFVGHNRVSMVQRSASEQIQNDLNHTVGSLAFAQVGADVPGRLQGMLRQSEEGPAFVVLEDIEPLLESVRDAAGAEAGDAGRAQVLLEQTDPSPAYVLGPVLGALTRGPESPPPAAPSTGSAEAVGDVARGVGELADDVGEVVDRVGEVAEAVGEIAEGVEEIAGGIESLADGVDSFGDAMDGIGAIVGGVSDIGGGLDELGLPLEGASLGEIASIVDQLGAGADVVGRLGDQAFDVTKVASEAAALAADAGDVVDDPNAKSAAALLKIASDAGREERRQRSDEDGSARRRPLAFLDALTGSSAAQTVWNTASAVVSNVGSILSAVSGVTDAIETLAEADGGAHPYEHDPVPFAAAVASAILRGRLGEEHEPEEEEDSSSADARSGESGQSDGGGDREESESSEDAPQHPPRGTGTWSFVVGGSDRENVAGTHVLGSGAGLRIGVGGSAREVAGLARVEQVGENRVEQTDGSKTESTGRYVVTAAEGLSVTSGAALRMAVSGDASLTVAGAHTLEGGSAVQLRADDLRLDATETVVFECGAARVSVSGDGIAIEGTEIVIRGSIIGVDTPALG